jgi:hypothetical protein
MPLVYIAVKISVFLQSWVCILSYFIVSLNHFHLLLTHCILIIWFKIYNCGTVLQYVFMSLLIWFVVINLYNKAYLARRGSMRATANSIGVQVAAYVLLGLPCLTGFKQGAKDTHWPSRLGVWAWGLYHHPIKFILSKSWQLGRPWTKTV